MSQSESLEEFKSNFKRRCFSFSVSVINLADSIPVKQSTRIILDQLIRSATSIGANVVEGGSSISKKEFISYFQIALKSSSETLYWLSLLKEQYPNNKLIVELIDECTQIKKLLTSILKKSKSNS